jgi:hypothetical protein
MPDDIVLGAKQLKNPKGLKPQLDTDSPAKPRNSGMSTSPYYKGDSGMDTSNPGPTNIEPRKKDDSDLFTMHGISRNAPRHQLGHMVPKNHPAIQISEN